MAKDVRKIKRLEGQLQQLKNKQESLQRYRQEVNNAIAEKHAVEKRLQEQTELSKTQTDEAEQMQSALQTIVSSLQLRINILSKKTTRTPMGLAQVLDLSPHSTKQVLTL